MTYTGSENQPIAFGLVKHESFKKTSLSEIVIQITIQ